MNRLTYEQLIEIDGILHEPLSSQQKQLRELEDLFNSILASQRQAILKEVSEEVIGEDYVLERPKEDYLPNVYIHLKAKNELRAEQRIKLDAIERKYELHGY